MAMLMLILKYLEMRFIIIDHSFEIYTAAIAIIFTSMGIWLAIQLTRRKENTVIIEKYIRISSDDPFMQNNAEVARLGISKREMEVLNLMAEGMSNNEIAEKLFVSQNTVKTHSSSIFQKLDVNRRIQAIEKARSLKIIR